jgi:D-alanyl-D-alanine carboxypeptidase/D-alanyl-D-alanine-endopeptidase (penicillin-binding protein 4)
MRISALTVFAALIFSSCSITRQLEKSAQENVLKTEALQTAHVGISIFEPATGKYWYNYQGDKYFVPASNIKIPTCYAAMKYLGDSLVGLEYVIEDSFLLFRGTGDPTLLHPDFKDQKILNYLKQEKKTLVISEANFTDFRWGSGWGIGDITASYAPERNEIPVYGNTLRIFKRGDSIVSLPSLYRSQIQTSYPNNWKINFERPSLNANYFTFCSLLPFCWDNFPFSGDMKKNF